MTSTILRIQSLIHRREKIKRSVTHSGQDSSLLTVTVVLKGGIRAEAVIDTAASGPVVNTELADKIGTLRRLTKAKISQADGNKLRGGNQVVNTSFSFISASNTSASSAFNLDAEVLDMGPREMVLGLSWLQEHDFCIDTVGKKIWREKDGIQIWCRERLIPKIEILKLGEWFNRDETIIILDATSQYTAYAKLWSSEQANRLPQHTEFDHAITFKDPSARPRNRPLYKTTWEEDEALRAYMAEHEPVGKVRRSTSCVASPILFT